MLSSYNVLIDRKHYGVYKYYWDVQTLILKEKIFLGKKLKELLMGDRLEYLKWKDLYSWYEYYTVIEKNVIKRKKKKKKNIMNYK